MAVSVNQQGASENTFIWRFKWSFTFGDIFSSSYVKKETESETFKLDSYGIHFSLKLMDSDKPGYLDLFICVKQIKISALGSLIITCNNNSIHYYFCKMRPGKHIVLTVYAERFLLCQEEFSVRIEWVEMKPQAATVESLISLSDDMDKLQKSEEFTDSVIMTDDKTSFPVDSAILSSRSPIFHAMFKTDKRESRKDCIEIKDLSSDTVRNLITYMYSGRFPTLDQDSATKLLNATKKYDFPELHLFCQSHLLKLLVCNNPLGLYRLINICLQTDSKESLLKLSSNQRDESSKQQEASENTFYWLGTWMAHGKYGEPCWMKEIESHICKLDGAHFNLKLLESDMSGYVHLFVCVTQVKRSAFGTLIITYRHNSLYYNFCNMSPGNYLALTFNAERFRHCQNDFMVKIEWVEKKQQTESLEQLNERLKNDSLISLSEHLNKMQESREFSDAVIVTDDGTSLPVHKAILTARSPVFCAMLKADMSESRKDCIEIKDLSPDNARKLITYMYTGRFPTLDYDSASELLNAAEKYDIPELKVFCVKRLLRLLDWTNALDLLLLMDTYREDDSKDIVLKFIANNRDQFSLRNSFKYLLGHPNLLTEILYSVINSSYRN